MTPIYKIEADGQDITAAIQGGLLSLTLTDNLGAAADTLSIRIAALAGALIIPDPDTTLRVSLGYAGGVLRLMGTFTVDEVEWENPPEALSISAQSAVYSDEGSPAEFAAFQTKKTRSWENGTKLADIVAKIASEHSMQSFVSQSLTDVVLPQTDQTDESDTHFLARIVASLGGCAKIAHKCISAVTAPDVYAAAAAASSDEPALKIGPYGYTRIKWGSRKRQYYRRVVAVWRDVAAAVDREVIVGDTGEGLPEDRIKGTFPDAATATAAASARYNQVQRDGKTLELTIPAPADMAPSADSPVEISGIGAHVDGTWLPRSVSWTLSRAGLSVMLRCEASVSAATGASESE